MEFVNLHNIYTTNPLIYKNKFYKSLKFWNNFFLSILDEKQTDLQARLTRAETDAANSQLDLDMKQQLVDLLQDNIKASQAERDQLASKAKDLQRDLDAERQVVGFIKTFIFTSFKRKKLFFFFFLLVICIKRKNATGKGKFSQCFETIHGD